jgi:tRNA G18 (ribose-2'-O)-methylase SpoU
MAYELTELSPKHLSYFQSLKGKSGHLADGIFIAEGPKIVEHVLRSNCEIPYGLMTPAFFERFKPLFERIGIVTQLHVVPKSEMESIVGFDLHQGVMLAASIPPQPTLQLIARKENFTLVGLEGIADAENMGTLIRTAAGFGVDAVMIDSTCCDPFLRRSVRVSMGTVVNVPVIRVDSLRRAIMDLKSSKPLLTVAAAIHETSVPLEQVGWKRDSMIMLGAEGTGLSATSIEAADLIAQIPMAPGIDSLNVGVACGIFLHQRSLSMRSHNPN